MWQYLIFVYWAVDGGFSDWSACDATCGAGKKTRTCNDPAPTDGGADCVGDLSEDCNIAGCPSIFFFHYFPLAYFSNWIIPFFKVRLLYVKNIFFFWIFFFVAYLVDGGFRGWGECDATCGTGKKTRACDDPAATYGGAYCVGDLS